MPWVEGEALTPSNLNAINGILYDVRDPAYGAIGNGTTNDAPAIQAALNAAGSAGGGTVQLSAGTFLINSGLTVPNRVRLLGQTNGGVGVSVIQASSTFSDSFMIRNAAIDGTQSYAWLDRIQLDGNSSSGNTVQAGIRWENIYVNSSIRHCLVRSVSGVGIYLVGSATTGGDVQLIEDNIVTSTGSHGVVVEGFWEGVKIINSAVEAQAQGCACVFFNGTPAITGGKSSFGHRIHNLHTEFSTASTMGIWLKDVTDTLIDGYVFDGGLSSNQTGIFISGTTGGSVVVINARTGGLNTVMQDDFSGVTVSVSGGHLPMYSQSSVRLPAIMVDTLQPLSVNTLTSTSTFSTIGAVISTDIALGPIAGKHRLQRANANRFDIFDENNALGAIGLGTLSVGTTSSSATFTVNGPSAFTDGTALAPSLGLMSELSLGMYRSGASTLALSYGMLNVRNGALSVRSTNASATSATLNDGEFRVAAVSVTSAELAYRSGNTTYRFIAAATAV